jgi:type II secretory pathway pseudopilin PulG
MKIVSAFSLVEVVVATGIFALAVVSVLGVLAATSKSVIETKESDDSIRLLGRIQDGLQYEYTHKGYATFKNYIGTGIKLYASKNSDKIGTDEDDDKSKSKDIENSNIDDMWKDDKEKFFEIELLENNQFPKSKYDEMGFLSFFIRISWPAYLTNGSRVSGNQSVLIAPCTITR